MASLSADKTKKALLNKGFVQDDRHHHFYLLYHQGKVVVYTKMSHNDQDIGDQLISKMYKQCKINKRQFFDLIDCSLSGDGYIDILKENGTIA